MIYSLLVIITEILFVIVALVLSVRIFKYVYFFIDVGINIFFLISGFRNNWDMASWFDTTQWCILYWFIRFIFVLVIYYVKRKKNILYIIESNILRIYRNIRDCLVFINIMINGITALLVVIHQMLILGA